MEEVSCTQNDLMQVMQKLLNERKKVKTLEQEVLHLRQDSVSPLTASLPLSHTRSSELIERAPLVDEKSENLSQLPGKSSQQLFGATQTSDAKHAENEQQVQLLKNIIKELAEKLKEANSQPAQILPTPTPSVSEAPSAPISTSQLAPQPVSTQIVPQDSPDSSTWQLKHNLYHAQNEVRLIKERYAAQEEEIRRLQQFRSTIQAELKEQKIKGHEGELAKQAIVQDFVKSQETYKEHQAKLEEALRQATERVGFLDEETKSYRLKIAELAESSAEKDTPFTLSQESARELQLANDLHEQRAKLHKLELALEDQQLLFYEISAKNKALEVKNLSLTTEKQAAVTQLQETSKELTQKDILYKEIIREKETLLEACKQLEQELKEQKHRLAIAEEETKKIKAQNQDLKLQIAELEKKCQSLAEKDEIIEEKELALEQLKQKSANQETLGNDYKNQIELLEQHLTRKVKECAQLANSQEEQESELSLLRSEHHKKDKKIDELASELMSLNLREKELIEQATFANEDQENRLAAQYELLQNQAQEITSLKKIEEKYLVLEQLLGRISSAISTGDTLDPPSQSRHFADETFHVPQKSHSPAFLQNSSSLQKPIIKEPPKPQPQHLPPTANDLFMSPKDKAVRHDFFQ